MISSVRGHRVLRLALSITAFAGGAFAYAGAAQAQALPTLNPQQYAAALIGAPVAWQRGYTGQGITVAVADSGIDTAHPTFAGKIDPRSRNYVLPAAGTAYDPLQVSDPDGHGTHVAGIIAGSGTAGAPGIAFNARLVALRAVPSCQPGQNCSPADVPNPSASAITYFAGLQNVMVYNASYGPSAPKTPVNVWAANTIDPDEQAAMITALSAGKIIVAANGNDGETQPVAGKNPSGMALYPFIRPANANAGVYNDGGANYDFSALLNQPGLVIAVNSVGQDKRIAPYSQACGVTASWCLSAPGGNQNSDAGIYSSLPGGNYGIQQGTSQATPAVSGALAVLQQAYPAYTARDLANVLFATAENVGGLAGVNATYGYGMVRLDRAIDGPTTLAAGSAVSVASGQVTYWSQPLTTAGAFSKAGPGSLIIAGRTTATGAVTVAGGALGVDGTLAAQGGLTVAQGAILAGFGTITGNTTVNGTLSPGQLPNTADVLANGGVAAPAGAAATSPGIITFQGNVTLAGSMLEAIDGALVNPGGPGTFSKVIVSGAGNSLTAGGTLVPVLRGIPGGNNNYTPAYGTQFQFVSATNGATITGQFAGVTATTAGLPANSRLDVVYGASAITLNVTPLNFAVVARQDNLAPNAQAVATALDTARPAPGIRSTNSESNSLLSDLYDDSEAQLDDAFLSLSGQGLSAAPALLLGQFSGFAGMITGRQAVMPRGAAPQRLALSSAIMSDAATGMLTPPREWTGWAQGFGSWSGIGDDAGLPGAHAATSGFAVGADRPLSDTLTVGGALTFQQSAATSFGARTDAKNTSLAAYASWMRGGFALDGRIVGGHTSIDVTDPKTILGATATGSADGWGVLGAVEAGYQFGGETFSLKPFAGLSAQTFRRESFSETTTYGLDFPGQDFSQVTTSLGLQSVALFTVAGSDVAANARAAWTHDGGDSGLITHALLLGGPFDIEAAHPGRDAAVVNVGVETPLTDTISLAVSYDGEYRANATTHAVRGGVRVGL